MQHTRNTQNNSKAQNMNDSPQPSNSPDYFAMQYRLVHVEDGWKTRKERIGSAFNKANGSICLTPSGRQIIENDIYLFPNEIDLNND